MLWMVTNQVDTAGARLADRHYSRRTPGSRQFVPAGRHLVLRTEPGDAVWVTSWPTMGYNPHGVAPWWTGAWICALFRNESKTLSSVLVRQAVSATRWKYPDTPALGMVTFIDASKVRAKRDPGRCYRKAGFSAAGKTGNGLVILQLRPESMPEPEAPFTRQLELVSL
jgi:hypothetical protein